MKENIAYKVITTNRKARHEFSILDNYEAGIALVGTEVKSLRAGKINLTDSYARIKKGEVWLMNAHISVYDQGSYNNHDPIRPRRLLLNKREIRKLQKAVDEKGNTLIPLRLYFKKGLAKVDLGVAKGKQLHDKRRDIADKDMKRSAERNIKI